MAQAVVGERCSGPARRRQRAFPPPQGEGEMAEFSDHQVQEKLKRVLEIFSSGIALNLSDKGEKLRLSLRNLQLELNRRRLSPLARKQSVSALNSADTREMKEQLDVIIGLITDRLAKDCEMKEQLDVIIGLGKDWLAKDQEKRLSAIEQQAKEREAFKNRVKLIQMMKEWNLEFVGTCDDPMKAEDWIMGMEKHFSLFGTTDEDKVTIAAFMLNDGAHYWWESVQSSHPETAGPITWETFKNAFYDRYLPWSLRIQKEREFTDLEQGDRSVAEYELEFSRLARFAPQLVRDEYRRASRFVRGLRPEIQVFVYNPKTLLEASHTALLVESANIKCEQEEEVQPSDQQGNRKRGRYNNSSFGGWHNNTTAQM